MDQSLAEELRSDIGCGIGCAIQNVISNYCMVEVDEIDGEIEYGSDDENGGLTFDFTAVQSFRNNGKEKYFTYSVSISESNYKDPVFIENLLNDIRMEVERQF